MSEVSQDEKNLIELLEYIEESLKPQHLKMAQLLAEGKSQGDAYADSGGKGKDKYKCGSDIVKRNPDILEWVEKSKQLSAFRSKEKLIATATQKREMLWEAAQRCMQEIEPVYQGRGEDKEIVGYTFDSKGVVSAISELNKMDGDHAPTKSINANIHKDFESLQDHELDQEIRQMEKQLVESASVH